MSKLAALQGKAQKFNIGGVELELKPLGIEELDMFTVDEKAPMEKQIEVSRNILKTILKKSVPEATEEELNNISTEHLSDLMEAVNKLHNITAAKDSRMEHIKNVVKSRQTQAKDPEQKA